MTRKSKIICIMLGLIIIIAMIPIVAMADEAVTSEDNVEVVYTASIEAPAMSPLYNNVNNISISNKSGKAIKETSASTGDDVILDVAIAAILTGIAVLIGVATVEMRRELKKKPPF